MTESDIDDVADRGDIEPPCTHWDVLVGTVLAGVPGDGPSASVATCQKCVVRSQGYVQMRTGIVADPLRPYPRE